MQLIYHPAAEAELIAAAQYYEHQIPGLGRDFLQGIDCAVQAIQEAPMRWNVVDV